MRGIRNAPDSPAARRWCELCGRLIHVAEPRLALQACQDMSATLWHLDAYRALTPHDAAFKFLRVNQELFASAFSA